MSATDTITVGGYVAEDFRTAAVFSKFGIDFCCKGNLTLDEVCQKKGLDISSVQSEINAVLESKSDLGIDFKSWPVDLLVDYIEKTHHRYVEEKSAILLTYLDKLCKVHGESHPELFEINSLFKASVGALAQHMKKEELVLFPFVKKMYAAINDNSKIEQPHFGTVNNPIAMMKEEHDDEGERFRAIAELSNNYTPPADACGTYRVTYQMLRDFEQDLHKHIHLENNILFLKAKEMEQRFMLM